jgi:hypothetical protein
MKVPAKMMWNEPNSAAATHKWLVISWRNQTSRLAVLSVMAVNFTLNKINSSMKAQQGAHP